MKKQIFYRPEGAVAVDFIPFHDKGRFQLFFLLDRRDPSRFGEGTPWHLVSTTDFTTFTEHGEVLGRGGREDQDLYVFTGSVLSSADGYHVFYTGHNPHLRGSGRPEQAVMHATSQDLLHWTKHPQDTFFAPESGYEPHDWRDPFVFWNPEAEEYWMLLAARTREGPAVRRGCTALCASKDLKSWELRDPLWSPKLYYTHECPDLFRIGDCWYLVYSEFSDRNITRYRMAHRLSGPWVQPPDDAFDGRACYAAKTATDGERRYLFGWNPTKTDENDELGWQWGGSLVVHEIFQRPDLTLGTRAPASVLEAFPRQIPIGGSLEPFSGGVEAVDGATVLPLPCRFPPVFRLDLDFTFSRDTSRCGVGLRMEEGQDGSFCYLLEPARNRFAFERWPRYPWLPSSWSSCNTRFCERTLPLSSDEPHHLTLLVENTVCVAYLDGHAALSGRIYRDQGEGVGLIAMGGAMDVSDVRAWTVAEER